MHTIGVEKNSIIRDSNPVEMDKVEELRRGGSANLAQPRKGGEERGAPVLHPERAIMMSESLPDQQQGDAAS